MSKYIVALQKAELPISSASTPIVTRLSEVAWIGTGGDKVEPMKSAKLAPRNTLPLKPAALLRVIRKILRCEPKIFAWTPNPT